jgi:MtrB/PioB family decaheme-associated outer membrane protein
MKTRNFIVAISVLFLPAFPVFAMDSTFEGEMNVTGEIVNMSGNKAKFNEYRDIRKNDLYSGFRLKFDSDDFFVQGKASDIGYNDQHYRIDGGAYGKFKFYLDYNEIPHNFTFDAKTFYNGAGSNTLTNMFAVFPTADTSAWNHFDYAIKRQTAEGGFTLQMPKPFYISVSASREERTGTIPMAVTGNATAGPVFELPQPVDYTTDTVKAEIGYAKKPIFAALSAEYSTFDNANHRLFFTNPSPAGGNLGDAINLAPNNQYYKISFRGSVNLPLNSKFNVNLGTSRTTSDADLFNSYVTGNPGAVVNIPVSSLLFHGQVDTQNYQAVLTSNPVSFLSAKIYYKYYERHNTSDQITVTDGGNTYANPLFSYHKNSAGIDLGFKLPAQFHLQTAYGYTITDRIRGDLPETRDNLYSAELKWKGSDFITPKIGYEHLERSSDHEALNKLYASDQQQENAIAPFFSRFDAANQSRDIYKAAVDIYPLDKLNFNIGYKYKMIDYQNTVLGLRRTTGHVANIDAGYTIGNIVQLSAYVDYEANRSYLFLRTLPAPPVTTANPFGPSDATSYNWDARMQDNSFAYGARVDLFIIPKKLTLVVQYDNVNSNGRDDFTYLFGGALAGGRTQDNIDIGAVDDYTLRSLIAKVVYTPWKPLTMVAGYAYESFTYNDAAWDGYVNVPNANTFLTGAYANPNYHANVVFISANYRF